jgi:sensor histidine kinase YesM
MQRDWTTVEEDFKLAGAYLDLARIRIGERLNPRIHAAFEAKTAEIPPLMVLTLLENAIQHAVEPNAGATAIDVSAELTSTNQLVIRVADTGAGFGANQSGGSGLGLANIRERLQSLYRGEAELKLSANSPSGVVAELRLPFKAVCAQANP